MQEPVLKSIQSLFLKLANLGITDDLSFHEKKKTQLLNVVVGSGIPVNAYFGIHNALHDKTLLAFINLCLLIGGFLILYINSKRKFLLGRLVMTFLASILFSASAVFFRNGGEYYLIANLIIIIIYFTEKKFLVSVTLLNCLLFIGIKIFLMGSYVYDTVPLSRVVFNISWTLLTMVLALMFFKNEQVSYQKQVEEKNRELEELNKTKQKLFSIISHDLKSPIAQLKGSLDLVNREYLSPEEFGKISVKLSAQVDQLHITLDNLLRWSISQFQGIVARPEKTALPDFFHSQLLPLLKQSIEGKNIVLTTDIPDLSVFADTEHLLLVFRNLLANAIKYSYQNGTITITAHKQGNTIITEITDEGIGMNEETCRSIFNPVSMVSFTGTSNEKGTGLGLKLCKEFIEKNSGQVWVESQEQKGSTFYVSLPHAN